MRLLQPVSPSGNENFSKVNTHGEGKNLISAFLFNTICQSVANIALGERVPCKAVILEKSGDRKKWKLNTLGQL